MRKSVIFILLVITLLLGVYFINQNNNKKEFISIYKGEGENWSAEFKIEKDNFISKNGTDWTVCEFKIKYKKKNEEGLSLREICYGYEWEQVKGGTVRRNKIHKECECTIDDTELLKQKEYISISYESKLNLEYKSDVIKVFIKWDDNEESFEINKVE